MHACDVMAIITPESGLCAVCLLACVAWHQHTPTSMQACTMANSLVKMLFACCSSGDVFQSTIWHADLNTD
jgi:hypothetical protein